MEESLVKLRLSELARIKSKAEAKGTMSPTQSSTQKDGRYYLVRLEMEREKIKSMIDSAEQDARLSQVPEDVLGKIRNAIGKAQLLITKRFKQFEELCRDNIENDPDKKETKSSDLLGYWEMMFIQIDDVSALFSDIAKVKANNWKAIDALDGPKPISKILTPKNKRKSSGNKSPRSKGNSVDDEKVKREAKNRLAAARKQAKLRMLQEQKEQKNNGSDISIHDNSLNSSLNGSMKNGDISLDSSLNSSMELLSTNDDSPTNTQSSVSETSSPMNSPQKTKSDTEITDEIEPLEKYDSNVVDQELTLPTVTIEQAS